MKILMTARHYGKSGGISSYVHNLATRFSKEHEVHICTSVVHTNPLIIEAGSFFLQSTIRQCLKDYDICHTEGGEGLFPGIITAHSIHAGAIDFMKKKRLGFMDRYLLTIEKLNYQIAPTYKKIICVSESSKNELMQYYDIPEKDIEVIYHGVDSDIFLPGFYEMKLHEINNIRLLIVATEFYRKGIIELITTVSMLIHRGCPVCLDIVGKQRDEGVYNFDVQELCHKLDVQSYVSIHGSVTREQLIRFYQNADIFVFPTKYEAFGIPTLEAMSCGIPVINSKIGAGELITDGYDGLLLDDPNDILELVDKIESLVYDKDKRKKLGENARKTALKYTWDETAKQTMKVYNLARCPHL